MNHTALQRFLRDSGGNLTPMFALTLLPVVGLIGITVDYTQSSTRKIGARRHRRFRFVVGGHAGHAGVGASRSRSIPQRTCSTARSRWSTASARSRCRSPRPTAACPVPSMSRYQTTSSTLFGGFTGKTSMPIAGIVAVDRDGSAQYRFLSAARQFAFDGDRGDDCRHQYDGRPHARPMCLRVP